MAADLHRAFPDIVEAVKQRRGRSLAGPGRPNQGHRFTGFHLEINVLQNRLVWKISERHIFELNRAVDILKHDGVWLVLDIDRNIDHLEYSFTGSHCALQNVVVHRQRADRVEEPLHEQDEGDHHTGFNRSTQHKKAAHDHNNCHCRTRESVDDRQHHHTELGSQVCSAEVFRSPDVEKVVVHVFA